MDQEKELIDDVGQQCPECRREFLTLASVGAVAGLVAGLLGTDTAEAQRGPRSRRDEAPQLPRVAVDDLERSRGELRAAVANALGRDKLSHLDRVVPLLRQGNMAAARNEWRQAIETGASGTQPAVDSVIFIATKIIQEEGAMGAEQSQAILQALQEFERELLKTRQSKMDQMLDARMEAQEAQAALELMPRVLAMVMLILTLILWLLEDALGDDGE